jgi:protocatechuate 3,4-dioxygenase, beta subunit
MKQLNRRNFIRAGLTVGAISAADKALGAVLCLRPTPQQTEGPFYPVDDQVDKDADLTFVQGGSQRAEGEVIYLTGRVIDQDCKPVEGALVEIWQACKSGKYNHKNDPNPAPVDPNFQYWGQAVTNKEGEYIFKTILPGAYPADEDWMRPPHIHFKVHKRGYRELTSQLYFAGEALNEKDLILQNLSKEDQKRVTVTLVPTFNPKLEAGTRSGNLDISISRVKSPFKD